MSQQRRIARVVSVPPRGPGFIGPGHLAAQVVSPGDFILNDPFIMLADDHLDIGDRTVGEPHPHAGFETVTLILDGAIYDRDEPLGDGVIRSDFRDGGFRLPLTRFALRFQSSHNIRQLRRCAVEA